MFAAQRDQQLERDRERDREWGIPTRERRPSFGGVSYGVAASVSEIGERLVVPDRQTRERSRSRSKSRSRSRSPNVPIAPLSVSPSASSFMPVPMASPSSAGHYGSPYKSEYGQYATSPSRSHYPSYSVDAIPRSAPSSAPPAQTSHVIHVIHHSSHHSKKHKHKHHSTGIRSASKTRGSESDHERGYASERDKDGRWGHGWSHANEKERKERKKREEKEREKQKEREKEKEKERKKKKRADSGNTSDSSDEKKKKAHRHHKPRHSHSYSHIPAGPHVVTLPSPITPVHSAPAQYQYQYQQQQIQHPIKHSASYTNMHSQNHSQERLQHQSNVLVKPRPGHKHSHSLSFPIPAHALGPTLQIPVAAGHAISHSHGHRPSSPQHHHGYRPPSPSSPQYAMHYSSGGGGRPPSPNTLTAGFNGLSVSPTTAAAVGPGKQPAKPLKSAMKPSTHVHPEPAHSGHFQYSRCTGRKRAVCIGINYTNSPHALRGCINDAKHVRQFLINHGHYRSEEVVLLTDEGDDKRSWPTRENIINAMKWLVRGARQDDSLFFHYAGHGGQTQDRDHDEVDGYDEVIYPLDFKRAGQIIDDEMHDLMVRPLPTGCRLTALFDSCHSGTVLDLPYIYSSHGRLKGSHARKRKAAKADVISWSGCKDGQTSADTFAGGVAVGAMSYAFMTSLTDKPKQTYQELLRSVRLILHPRFSQKPQLGSSHHIDTGLTFVF